MDGTLVNFQLGISTDGTNCMMVFVDEDQRMTTCSANFNEFNQFIASLTQAASEMARRRSEQIEDGDGPALSLGAINVSSAAFKLCCARRLRAGRPGGQCGRSRRHPHVPGCRQPDDPRDAPDVAGHEHELRKRREEPMPRGDKSTYTDKQKRKAEHIEEGYEKRGVSAQGSRAPRLGHRQQGDRRRQEERLRPRQDGKPRLVAQGRQAGRRRVRTAPRRRAIGIGP